MRKGKRFELEINGKFIHFGSDVAQTFINGRNESDKKAWMARHKVNKNWNNKKSGIYYSRHLLWGKFKNLEKNIKELEKKDNIIIKYFK